MDIVGPSICNAFFGEKEKRFLSDHLSFNEKYCESFAVSFPGGFYFKEQTSRESETVCNLVPLRKTWTCFTPLSVKFGIRQVSSIFFIFFMFVFLL